MLQRQCQPRAPLPAAAARRAAGAGARPVAAAAAARGRSAAGGPALQELDLKRLYSDATYLPERLIGPVEVQTPPGKSRRVVTKRDVPIGTLLLVSEPLGGVLQAEPGRTLLPLDLLSHLQGQRLSEADRFKLCLLYDGSAASQQRQTSFRDFEASTATAKAAKAKTAAKGFGGAGGKAPQQPAAGQQQQLQQQQQGAGELTVGRLESILNYNAWGAEVSDLGAAPCRGEELRAFVGLWPEFALLNHSCVPNAGATLVGDRLVVRAASAIPRGAQVTTSYLDSKGGVPLADRRRALDAAYGFTCRCARCKLEEGAPEAVRAGIERLHGLCLPDAGGPFEGLAAATESLDSAALSRTLAAAAPELEAFHAVLDAGGFPAGSLNRVALSAGAASFFLQLQRAKVAAAEAAASAAAPGGGEDGGGGGGGVDPLELFDLVEIMRVYQPGGAGVLATAADALSYTAAKFGAGSSQAQAALQLFLKMLLIKFGEVQDRATLERLVDAVTRSSPRLASLGLDGGFAIAAEAGAASGGAGQQAAA
ncbi:hypothetical protein Rsub_06129 [Raphidocelis subcapitata]|uniref:SET domain-containing protein n=1 Tax=Raphidocelis subcapitata TaxID=307507 RepID=A0A2V0P9F6_9CHLO|nr:hypothetical protein Rsub_06129 [Raphidocelis subcapitata]|eukprot:GBF93797.1 hypothetical protein Rsub_06129 [Raphidocelis subcapitata]